MATTFPFVNADAGMDNGVPIGINKQTGLPLIFDNFSNTLANYNMIIFGKSGGESPSVYFYDQAGNKVAHSTFTGNIKLEETE